MLSKTDIRAYFKRRATGSGRPAAKKKNPNTEIIASAAEHINRAETEKVVGEVEKSTVHQSYNNIPKHIRMDVEKYALAHTTKDALAKLSKQYPKYPFKWTSIQSWKALLKKRGIAKIKKKIGRPNLLSKELLQRTKDEIFVSRLAGTVISSRMAINIETGVVKAN